MVGSDVREGLGKYKDVRPATGATGFDQASNTGAVHETGHTDSSVYRPRDMTDTATKEGSDQREGLGTAKGTTGATSTTTTTETKDTKHHHKHEKDTHHHKHEHTGAAFMASTAHTSSTTSSTMRDTTYPSSTTSATTHLHPESKTYGTTYTTTSGYTDMSGTPSSTHYKYDASDKTPYYGTSPSRDTTTTHRTDYSSPSYETSTTHRTVGDYSSPSHGYTGSAYEQGTSKLDSDQREGLGYGASDKPSSGWTDTTSKQGSDQREGLGTGTSNLKSGKFL